MNTLKIRYFDDKFGKVTTVLPKSRTYLNIQESDSKTLAQLVCDLMTIPQPELRNGEALNLIALLLIIGHDRYGQLFYKQVAIQFMKSIGD